jgi:nucleotide-binding universal stress UspA family protein
MRQAAAMKSCALHLVNVQAWLSHEAAESELLRRGWNATGGAREMLDAAAQPWRLHVVMGEAPESIAGLADRLGCQGIFIGHHGQGVTKTLLLGSVAQKVAHLSALPVIEVP